MEQKLILYWPQCKVYLYGRLVYLPELLVGRPLGVDELRHYFPLFHSVYDILADLRKYERDTYLKIKTTFSVGYLDWERSQMVMADRADPLYSNPYTLPDLGNVRAKIESQSPLTPEDIGNLLKRLGNKAKQYLRIELFDIAEQKLHDELAGYLAKYRQDELMTSDCTRPEVFDIQQMRLRDAAARDYQQHRYRPIIKYSDIWQNQPDQNPFWELILSNVAAGAIMLTKIGYDGKLHRLAPGVSIKYDGDMPFAEFTIVDEEMRRAVSPKSELKAPTPTANIVLSQPASAMNLRNVTIKMTTGGIIYADLTSGKHLIKKVRRDSAPYNFMDYMLGHQKKDIPRGVVQTKIDGCAAKKDMTELVKQCGFTKDLIALKSLHFSGTTKLNVHFNATVELNAAQAEHVMQREVLSI